MRIAGFENPLTLGLAAACAGLGAILGFQLLWQVPVVESPAPPRGEEETPLAMKGHFSLPPESEFSEIVERPLFMQSRRPPKPDEKGGTQNKEKPMQLGQYKLTGVVLTPHQRFALLQDATSKKIERIDEGKEKQGWTLKEVQADSVLLSRDGEDESLPLVRKTPDNVKLLTQSAAAKSRKTRQPPKGTGKPRQPPASQQMPRDKPPNNSAQQTQGETE